MSLSPPLARLRPLLLVAGLVTALAAAPAPPDDEAKDPQLGQSFRIPYRLTETNHYLVRVRVNGKGPFNFLVDSGAPALYVGTEAAKAVGLKPAEDDYWTPVDRLDLEGGATLKGLKARVEDPFQLVGMNALGLPGASIDGILGFTVLARYRLEFDPTDDRMTWTRIDYEPREPFLPKALRTKNGPKAPAEIRAMEALGPLMKLAAVFVGKQPEERLERQGLLGLTIERPEGEGGVRVAAVLEGSPAAKAGIEPGDRLVRILGHAIEDADDAHVAIAAIKPGDEVKLAVERKGETLERTVQAAEGF